MADGEPGPVPTIGGGRGAVVVGAIGELRHFCAEILLPLRSLPARFFLEAHLVLGEHETGSWAPVASPLEIEIRRTTCASGYDGPAGSLRTNRLTSTRALVSLVAEKCVPRGTRFSVSLPECADSAVFHASVRVLTLIRRIGGLSLDAMAYRIWRRFLGSACAGNFFVQHLDAHRGRAIQKWSQYLAPYERHLSRFRGRQTLSMLHKSACTLA